MTGLVKVRFTKDAIYRVHGYVHPDNPVYRAGTALELSEDQASRWLKRGVAEVVTEQEVKAEAVAGDAVSAEAPAAAPKADGDRGGIQSGADKRHTGKAVARDIRRDK